MNSNIETRIQAYFDHELSEAEKQHLKADLADNREALELFEAYTRIYQEMDQITWESPSTNLKNNFNDWLLNQQEEQLATSTKSKFNLDFSWRSAAAIGLLLIGACMGMVLMKNQQQQAEIAFLAKEMQKTQQLLTLSMLDQPSASQRIKAMSKVQTHAQSIDPKIIEALIDRLLNDENVNVRSTACEALSQFPASQQVILGLIQALESEIEPLVQISIIEALVKLKAGQAIPKLEDLLQRDTIIPVVKDQAAKGIEVLI
ncbi:MAG: hypothetical protein Sapg2KO_50470 [Saprospiraceae bacterium]